MSGHDESYDISGVWGGGKCPHALRKDCKGLGIVI